MKLPLKLFLLLVCSLLLFGCKDDDIAANLNQGKELTASEQQRYTEAKAELDKKAYVRLENIADKVMLGNKGQLTGTCPAELAGSKKKVEQIIIQKLEKFALKLIAGLDLTDDEKKIRNRYRRELEMKIIPKVRAELAKKHQVVYKRKNGTTGIFDISNTLYEKYHFHHGDIVSTQWGSATIIGMLDDKLWFQIDKVDGATYWTDIDDSFKLMKSSSTTAPKVASSIMIPHDDDISSQNIVHSIAMKKERLSKIPAATSSSQGGKTRYLQKIPDIPALPYNYY